MKNNFARYIYLTSQRLYGENVLRDLRELQESQRFSQERIKVLQLQKLKKLLDFLYRKNKYYRAEMKKNGLLPDDIKTLEDISLLPILEKSSVRKNYSSMLSDMRCRKEYRRTSGTTGVSLQFVKSKKATSLMRALDYRCLEWHGIHIGDRQARFWSSGLTRKESMVQTAKDYLLNRLRCSVFRLTEHGQRTIYKNLLKFKPDYLYGYVSGIYEFSKFCIENKLELPQVKAVVVTSEMLYIHQKDTITKAFSSPVIREYGSTEFGIIAFECPYGSLHIMDENIIIETLDSQYGSPGELIVTELNNYFMPLIRYKIGDVGILQESQCECGLKLSTMKSIEGRMCSFFQTPSGYLIYENVFDFINSVPGVDQLKVLLVAEDHLVIQLKGTRIVQDDLDKCRKKLFAVIGLDMTIDFEFVEDIPRDRSGKRNYFESLI